MVYPFGVLPTHQHVTFYLKFKKRLPESSLSMTDIPMQTIYFLTLKYLKYSDIHSFRLLSFIYQYQHDPPVSHFENLVIPLENIHDYGTRRSTRGNLYLQKFHTTQYGLRSAKYTGSILIRYFCYCFFLYIVVYHACLLSLDTVEIDPASRGEFNVYVLYVNFHVFLVVVLVMYL